MPAVMAMSLFVFAGSAQFIAVGLFGLSAPLIIILLVTFVVNLRHMLYSLSLVPYLQHLPQKWRAPLAFWLTDETYAVTIFHYRQSETNDGKHWFQLGSSISMYVNWQIWSFLGMVLGERLPNAQSWGLDVAMPIAFIGMIIPFVNTPPMFYCVFTAGTAAIVTNGLPYRLGIIISTICGIAAGIIASGLEENKKGRVSA